MRTFKIIPLLFVLAWLFSACAGGTVTTNIRPSSTPNVKFVAADNTVEMSKIRTVAIFPFADYSHQQDFLGINEWGGNIMIIEELKDHFTANGISVCIQEDVNTLLVDNGVIRPIDKERYLIHGTVEDKDTAYKRVGTPEYELANYGHTDVMQREIMRVMESNKRKEKVQNAKHSPVVQGVTVGLTKDKVREMGQFLGADIIIRGRIIDFGYKDIGTKNPLYRGFVPVAIDSVKELLYGATDAYGYDSDLEDIESILIGSALGYGIGSSLISRSSKSKSVLTSGLITGQTDINYTKSSNYGLEGAGIGAASGWLASRHPKQAKRSAVVQIRLYAQDVETARVMWSNRVEVEYTPKSNYAYQDNHPKVMFGKAVKAGVNDLMTSFFNETGYIAPKVVEARQ